LLGDVGGGAGAAGGVQDEVAGVGGHQEATPYHSTGRLDDVQLALTKRIEFERLPRRANLSVWEEVVIVSKAKHSTLSLEKTSPHDSAYAILVR
jgi:hypothetical protein